MKQSNQRLRHMKRAAIVAVTLLSALGVPWLASATEFDTSGTFGTTEYTGPLNGGTFIGTFEATLPASGFESITTYNVALINASGTTLADLTGLGGAGNVRPEPGSNCPGGVPCDVFTFANGATFLELTTPSGFTGGAVNPFFNSLPLPAVNSFVGFGGNTGSLASIVTSGRIVSAPEPPLALLMGTGLLACALLTRRSRAGSARPPSRAGRALGLIAPLE